MQLLGDIPHVPIRIHILGVIAVFRLGFTSIVAGTLLAAVSAQSAVITTYSNQASFVAATPGGFDPTGMAAQTVVATARGITQASDAIYGAADGLWVSGADDNYDFSFEHVTFSARPTIIGSIHTWENDSTVIAGMEYNIYNSQNENHSILFHGAGAMAFGFKALDPTNGICVTTCQDSSFTITVFNGATLLGTFNFNPPFSSVTAGYFGIVSDTAFTKISLAESSSGSFDYENDVFGEYRVVMAPETQEEPAPVPAPAGGMILAFGLAALSAVRRSQHGGKRGLWSGVYAGA